MRLVELKPPIETTLSVDKDPLNMKKGTAVTINKVSLNGSLAKLGTTPYFLPLDEYNLSENQLASIRRQAHGERRDFVTAESSRPPDAPRGPFRYNTYSKR